MSFYRGSVGEDGAGFSSNGSVSLDTPDSGDGTNITLASPTSSSDFSQANSSNPPSGAIGQMSDPNAQQGSSGASVGDTGDANGGMLASFEARLQEYDDKFSGTVNALTGGMFGGPGWGSLPGQAMTLGAQSQTKAIGSDTAGAFKSAGSGLYSSVQQGAQNAFDDLLAPLAAPAKQAVSTAKTIGIVIALLAGGAIIVYGMREANILRGAGA